MQKRLTELEKLCAQVIDIERETRSYQTKIRSLREPLPELFRRIIELKWGIVKGSIVQGRDGKKFRISRFENYENCHEKFDGYDKPWIVGNPQRQDGSFGTAERNLYRDWTPVKDEQSDSKT